MTRDEMDRIQVSNIFDLFAAKPGWQEAEAEINMTCQKFGAELRKLQEKYRDFGAQDTESRIRIGIYMEQLTIWEECEDWEPIVLARAPGSGTVGEGLESLLAIGRISLSPSAGEEAAKASLS